MRIFLNPFGLAGLVVAIILVVIFGTAQTSPNWISSSVFPFVSGVLLFNGALLIVAASRMPDSCDEYDDELE